MNKSYENNAHKGLDYGSATLRVFSADARKLFAPKHVHDAVPSNPGPEKDPSRVIRDDLPYAA